MAQTGERIRRACTAPMPADLYDRDDSASMVRCTRPEGHDGPHSATINRPRTVEWPCGQPPSDTSVNPAESGSSGGSDE